MHIAWMAFRIDDKRQGHGPLILRFPGFLRVLGVWVVDGARGGDASAELIDPATNAAAAPLADSRTIPGTDSCAFSGADATAASRSVRGRRENRGGWIASCSELRKFHLGRTNYSRLSRQLRNFVFHDDCGWSALLIGKTRSGSTRGWHFVLSAAASSAMKFAWRGGQKIVD